MTTPLPVATGVAGAQVPLRATAPPLPRRDIRRAGKYKQTQLISQLNLTLKELQLKLKLSIQREAAIVASCNAACAICLRFGMNDEFARTLVGAICLALHNLAAADSYILVPCPLQSDSPIYREQQTSSGDDAFDKEDSSVEQASTSPPAFDIFEAEDSMWTAPCVSKHTACADAAAGAGSPRVSLHLDLHDPASLPGPSASESDKPLPVQTRDEPLALHSEPFVDDRQCCAIGGPSPASYHAWSGKGMATTSGLHTTSTRLRNTITDPLDDSRRAPDDTNAKHQVPDMLMKHGPLLQDFTSQGLANSSVSELKVVDPCRGPGAAAHFDGPSAHIDFNSQSLASVSELFDEHQRPKEDGTWRALDDPNAKHQVPSILEKFGPSLQDSNSQGLANSFVSVLADADPCSEPGTTAQYVGPTAHFDFNSQNLASPCEPFVGHQRQKDVETWQALDDPHSKHQVPDMQTQCGPLPQDISSPAHAKTSEHLDVVTPGSGMCQLPGDSLVVSTWQALDDPNAKHQVADVQTKVNDETQQRVADVGTWQALDDPNAKHQAHDMQSQCGPLPQDFNSQVLAHSEHLEVVSPGSGTCRPPSAFLEVGTWRALDDTNAKHQVPDVLTKYGPSPQDSNSQDLANSLVSELEVADPSSENGTTAQYVGPSAHVDFDSRNLATAADGKSFRPSKEEQHKPTTGRSDVVTSSGEQCSTLAVEEPQPAQCGPLPQTAKDFTSQGLAYLDSKPQSANKDPDCPAHLTQQEYVSSLVLLAELHPEYGDHFSAALRKARQYL